MPNLNVENVELVFLRELLGVERLTGTGEFVAQSAGQKNHITTSSANRNLIFKCSVKVLVLLRPTIDLYMQREYEHESLTSACKTIYKSQTSRQIGADFVMISGQHEQKQRHSLRIFLIHRRARDVINRRGKTCSQDKFLILSERPSRSLPISFASKNSSGPGIKTRLIRLSGFGCLVAFPPLEGAKSLI
jgi:hypothetical protein